jgi:hypothetical protein
MREFATMVIAIVDKKGDDNHDSIVDYWSHTRGNS